MANDLAASNDFKSQLKVPIMFNNVKTSLENFYSILASYNIGRHQQHIDWTLYPYYSWPLSLKSSLNNIHFKKSTRHSL
jgi:hypothetical protein